MSDIHHLRERFWKFFEQNYPQLLRIAEWYATPDYPAEDLLQDAFLRAWDRLDSTKCDNWLAWLRQIMVYRRIDRYRKRDGAPVVLAGDITADENADIIASAASETLSPGELAERLGDTLLMKQALACMKNEHQRRVLELVLDNFATDGGPNLKKVAEDMTISHSNAKQLYQRARETLKQYIRPLAKEMNIPTERPNHET